MAKPQDMSRSDGSFWLPDSGGSCVGSIQHTAGRFRDSLSVPSQKAAPYCILYCVSVERRQRKLCLKRLLQMPVGIGFACGVLTSHCSAWWELQALKEAVFCQETVSARDFEQLTLCCLLTYLLHSL